jgi:hypothetical protein
MVQKAYLEYKNKVVETDTRFEHVMAIALNPSAAYKEGVIRCITSRSGDVATSGFMDKSQLYKINGDGLEAFKIGNHLDIKNEKEIIGEIAGTNWECLGLEDPDIWIDANTGLTHLYFTLPFVSKNPGKHQYKINLGHAVGKNLDTLEMTLPVLSVTEDVPGGAKELCIAPQNVRGFRYNLVESGQQEADFIYSVVRVAIAENMGHPWQYGDIAFHPKQHNIPWIAGHASPGPLLPKSFLNVGEGKILGIMNGREANQKLGDQIKYGMFAVGLFIYDYENGIIDWVSPQPLIRDSQARTITFASQFVEQKPGHGILYAHVDDSFVRAYTLNADGIKLLLP